MQLNLSNVAFVIDQNSSANYSVGMETLERTSKNLERLETHLQQRAIAAGKRVITRAPGKPRI
jgi:hypothetical protein